MRILTLRFFANPIHLQSLKLSANATAGCLVSRIKGQLEKRGQVAQMEEILLLH
jgi:hypothetical protein